MENYQYTLTLKALREVQEEITPTTAPARGELIFPDMVDIFSTLGPLPDNTLLMGLAGDGLPLLFHLRDPRSGPLLITGDSGAGKTAFLKGLVRLASMRLNPPETHFITITNFPNEWANFNVPGFFLGTAPAYAPETSDLLFHLAYRSQKREEQTPTLLLFDGLEAILDMEDAARSNLRYLLTYGPQALIWPVVTINSAEAVQMPDWISNFRTRIFGNIASPAITQELTPIPGAPLNTLFPGMQFCLREKSHWLKFWAIGGPE